MDLQLLQHPCAAPPYGHRSATILLSPVGASAFRRSRWQPGSALPSRRSSAWKKATCGCRCISSLAACMYSANSTGSPHCSTARTMKSASRWLTKRFRNEYAARPDTHPTVRCETGVHQHSPGCKSSTGQCRHGGRRTDLCKTRRPRKHQFCLRSGYFSLGQAEALAILSGIVNTLSAWKAVATSPMVGMTAREVEDFSPAFQHAQREEKPKLLG
jgi:hypothetical protein